MTKNLNFNSAHSAVSVFRGDLCENRHTAFGVLFRPEEPCIDLFPESSTLQAFLRSSGKPFQALPLLNHPRASEIPQDEWAIIVSSHAATPTQLTLVQRVLERAQATSAMLQCGPHPPLDPEQAKALLREGLSPSACHNNCSGKHAGFLLACHYYGWPTDNYLDVNHPLQQAILKEIKALSGETHIHVGIDGCGAPIASLPMKGSAKLFSQLVCNPHLSGLSETMIRYPEIVGDTLRVDSQLMKVSHGDIVAKSGADGFIGAARRSTGEGLTLKIMDGSAAIRDRLLIAVLENQKWLSLEQAASLWAQPCFSKERRNTQDKVVGTYHFHIPEMSP